MKQWLETREVLDRLAELRREGRGAALATVVRVRGSAYRREGAKLLVADDGGTVGNVSGGCLEQDVREVALRVLETGRPELRAYCSGADEVSAWDLGVGCEGQVEVLVEPVAGPRDGERALLDGDAPFAVCSLLPGGAEAAPAGRLIVTPEGSEGGLGSPVLDGAVAERTRALLGEASSGIYEIAGREVFVELYAPPPRLVVVGAGEDARPLARLGLEVGFRVVVVDRRPGLLAPERFPAGVRLLLADPDRLAGLLSPDEGCHVVLMTHSYADDERYLRVLARAPLPYLGILGPRQRTERLLRAVGADAPLDEARIYGPVGLDLGTEGAEQVALSILAEILAVRAGRRAGSLRERRWPIHVAAD